MFWWIRKLLTDRFCSINLCWSTWTTESQFSGSIWATEYWLRHLLWLCLDNRCRCQRISQHLNLSPYEQWYNNIVLYRKSSLNFYKKVSLARLKTQFMRLNNCSSQFYIFSLHTVVTIWCKYNFFCSVTSVTIFLISAFLFSFFNQF